MKASLYYLTLLFCLSLGLSTGRAETYQLEDGFEAETLQKPWRIEHPSEDTANVSIQNSPVRAGAKAVHLVNNYTDPDGARLRTEMVTQNAGTIQWDREYWVGFSFYLKDWTPSPFAEAVHQFHAVPHANNWKNKSARNLTTLVVKEGNLCLAVIQHPVTDAAKGGAVADLVWSEPVKSDTWYDWIFHLRPTRQDNGVIEAWCNGKQVYQQNGPNVDHLDCSGQDSEPRYYLKCGVYNWPWGKGYKGIDRREIIYDEVRIGCVESGYKSGYQGVAPGK